MMVANNEFQAMEFANENEAMHELEHRFQRRQFLKGCYLGPVTWIVMYTLVPPSYRCFISNLCLTGQAGSEKNIFEYYGHVY